MRAWVALSLFVALASAPSFADPVAANAWGANLHGQLGDGSPLTKRLEPFQIGGLDTAVALDGGNAHSLALSSDHTVWAWGSNFRGQIGDGTNDERRLPVVVPGLTEVAAISAGYDHSLALKSDHTVWSWGANQHGQLGDGTNSSRNAPVQVVGLPPAKSVAGGGNFYGSHTLAVAEDGTVWAWGRNAYGQLGDGTTSDRFTPVQVTGLTDVVAVAAGAEFSLALKTDHTVWAWGRNNYGQLGDGTNTNRWTPVQVWTVDDAEAIGAGDGHALALRTNHRMWAWGLNTSGQLGDTTTTNKTVPVVSATIADAVGMACGGWHNMVLRSDGTVWAWGGNSVGQLGDGTTTGRLAPVQVLKLTGATCVGAGDAHSLAVALKRPPIATTLYAIERTATITEPVQLRARLRTLPDLVLMAGYAVDFAVDGTPVGTAYTGDASTLGLAWLDWVVPDGPEARTIGATFAGTSEYLPSSSAAPLTCQSWIMKMAVMDRVQRIGGLTELKARLVRSDDKPVEGKTLQFSMDGTFVAERRTDYKGYGRVWNYLVTDGAGAGLRTIGSEWAGNPGYHAVSGAATLTALKATPYIWVLSKSVLQGGTAKLYAYFRRLPDWTPQEAKPVTFRVDGTWVADVLTGSGASAGTARHMYPVVEPPGAHVIRCEFAGDAWVEAGYGEGVLTIL